MIDPGQPAVSATHRGRVAPVPRRRRRAAVDPGRESVLARADGVCASAGVITLGHARGGDRLQCGPRGLLDDALHSCSRRASHPAVDAPRLVNSLLARRRHPPLDGDEQRRSREHRSQILPEFAFSVPVSRRCLRIQYTPRMSAVHSGSSHIRRNSARVATSTSPAATNSRAGCSPTTNSAPINSSIATAAARDR